MNRYKMHLPKQAITTFIIEVGSRVKFKESYIDGLMSDIPKKRWMAMRGTIVGDIGRNERVRVKWDLHSINVGNSESTEDKDSLIHE